MVTPSTRKVDSFVVGKVPVHWAKTAFCDDQVICLFARMDMVPLSSKEAKPKHCTFSDIVIMLQSSRFSVDMRVP